MGDSTAPNPLSAPFPAPPSFYHNFTPEKLSQLEEIEKQAISEKKQVDSDIPPELQCLRPPTPPANGTYRSFGEERSLDASLSVLPLETRALPPPPVGQHDKGMPLAASPSALLTITRSLLLSYLELLHILSANPDAAVYGPKWEDLRDLFQNAHAMINAYRGWQGREALIALLEGEVQRGRESVMEWEIMEKRVNEVLKQVEGGEQKVASDSEWLSKTTNGTKRKRGEEKRLWEIMGAHS